jgi:hypothetical protein
MTLGFWMRLVFGLSAWPFFFTRLICIGHVTAEILCIELDPPDRPLWFWCLQTLCDVNYLVRSLRSVLYWPRIQAKLALSALDLPICLAVTLLLIYYTKKPLTTKMPQGLGIVHVTAHS